MKGIYLACLVALFLVGCDRSPVEEYADEMLVSYQISRTAADEASLQASQRYIQSYRAMNENTRRASRNGECPRHRVRPRAV